MDLEILKKSCNQYKIVVRNGRWILVKAKA